GSGERCGLYAGIGRETAVHRQGDAGDEAGGGIVDEEQQRAFQLAAVAEAAHGGGGQNFAGAGGGGAVGVIQELLVLPGGKEAGGNGVDPDALPAEVDGQPLGQVGDGGFRARIGGDLGQGGVGVHAGDVQDAAAAAAQHLGHKGLGGQDGAQKIQIEHPGHRLGGEVEKAADGLVLPVAGLVVLLVGGGLGVVAARAVHQDVAGAEV